LQPRSEREWRTHQHKQSKTFQGYSPIGKVRSDGQISTIGLQSARPACRHAHSRDIRVIRVNYIDLTRFMRRCDYQDWIFTHALRARLMPSRGPLVSTVEFPHCIDSATLRCICITSKITSANHVSCKFVRMIVKLYACCARKL